MTGDGRGELVTTIDEEGDITRLDTAIDVVVVVVVEVEEVALELFGVELASALLRAWNSAARFLSFKILL